MSRPPLLAVCLAALGAGCATARPAAASTPVPATERTAPARERTASSAALSRYLSARLAEAAGDHAGAIADLRAAILHDPDSPQLRITYAETLARAGRLEPAEEEARRALALVGSDDAAGAADAHLALGRVLALSGRTQAALVELVAATRIEERRAKAAHDEDEDGDLDPEPWRALARARLDSGDVEGAVAACGELAALDRSEAASAFRELAGKLLEAKDAGGARKQLQRAVELAPAEPEGWKLLARMEEGEERFGEARAAWERAVSADPDDAESLLAAGRLALRDGDLARAREHLGALPTAAADEIGARIRVAAAWLDAKQPAEALAAVSVESSDPRLSYLRGVALEQLRRWADAAAAFALVEPGSGELYSSARASLAYALVRAGRPGDAVRAVRRGLREHPADPALLFALGQAYDGAGQREAAMEQMRAVLAVQADHAEALNYLGYSYAERGERLDEAQALLERALKVEPENGYYLDSLGWVYFKKGDVERAVRTLERADELSGPEPTILEHLGDSYRAAQRPGDAAAAYRRALDAAGSRGADAEPSAEARASVQRKLRELRRHGASPASAHARDAPAGGGSGRN